MLIIKSRVPSKNLQIYKGLSQLIQGFLYSNLPAKEHVGYRHSSGKVFRKTNFCFSYFDGNLEIKFTALEKELEEQLAINVLKNGLKLGEIHLLDTAINLSEHRTEKTEAKLKGYAACNVKGFLDKKVFLEPIDSRHLEIMTTNLLQKYETFYGSSYNGELEIELLWQDFERFRKFYYGNNKNYMKAWLGIWSMKADNELINLALSTGLGSGVMSYGCGFMEEV
ncbi:MAG: CRISPR-associated protein Cas6 [Campylobacteraceae bacterium]|nr:CRISPR-associated protein Cas6 [Campylobacteraceae bacterium]